MTFLDCSQIDHCLKFDIIVDDIDEEQLRARLTDRLDSA